MAIEFYPKEAIEQNLINFHNVIKKKNFEVPFMNWHKLCLNHRKIMFFKDWIGDGVWAGRQEVDVQTRIVISCTADIKASH